MIAFVLGLGIGLVMGLTGAGGGVLAVPALVFALGWPMAKAAPAALVAVTAAASLGVAEGLKRGVVRYRAAVFMAAIGMAFTPLGVRAAAAAPERLLLLAFAGALIVVSAKMLRQATPSIGSVQAVPPCRVDPATGRLRWTVAAAATLAAIGAAAGFLTGLLGVGGGFLIVPALRRFTDLTMQEIVASSLSVVALVSSAAVAAAMIHGYAPEWAVTGPFVAGAVAGMIAGRIGGRRLSAVHTQRIFGAMTAVVAVALILRALFG